jgi:thioredoxin reductase (NADPH)
MKTDFVIAVIGGGPAGLTAAVYAARAGHTVTILEGAACGGQMLLAHEIENYPGFTKIAGYALADQMMEQANSLGVSITYAQVDSVTKEDDHFTVLCGSKSFTASAVIVAAGAKHRTLDVPGEAEFIGRGVSYCAVCDGRFFAGKDVAVVGGGNTALGDAIYLSNICKSVTLIHRRDTFRADRILVRRMEAIDNIRTVMGARVTKIEGDQRVQSLDLVSVAESAMSQPMVLQADGVFIAVGNVPDLSMLSGIDGVQFDEGGYIVTDERCRSKFPGLFVAGDVRSKNLRQIATAVADGAIAGTEAAEYLDSLGK